MTRDTKEHIIVNLRDKISEILSVPADTVEKSKDFAELFSNATLRQTTDFFGFVANQYKTYLTESEWDEAHTLDKVADHILEKQANPQPMLEQIRKDIASLKKQIKFTLIGLPLIIGVPAALSIINMPHPDRRLHMALFMGSLIVLAAKGMNWMLTRQLKRFKDQISPILQHYNYNPEEKSPDKK